jgi:hypothetical protein
MSTFRFQLAVSLDGFIAGPDQSEENPLGVGGMDLHQWVFRLEAWRRQQGLEGGGQRQHAGGRGGAGERRRDRDGPQHVRRRARPLA